MRDVEILWEILPTRNDGSTFDIVNDVDNVEVSGRLVGNSFAVLGNVPPAGAQRLVSNLAPGDWEFRLVVVDTDGLRSAPVDTAPFSVVNDDPSGVTNVVVRFDNPST